MAPSQDPPIDPRAMALNVIDAIHHGMAEGRGFQAIVDLVGDKLRAMLSTDDIGIRWIDRRTRLIHFLYEYEGGQRRQVEPVALIAGGPGDTMARTRAAVVLNSPAEKAAAGIHDLPGTQASRSVVFVPILSRVSMLGTIVLEDYEREHAYGEYAIRLVSTIGATLGTALENARLFDETQRLLKETEQRNAELAVIGSIQQGMAGSLDLRAIIELVGDRLRAVFKSDDLAITWRGDEEGVSHLMYAVQHGVRLPTRSFRPDLEGRFMRALLANQPVLANSRAEMDAWAMHTPDGFEPSLATLTVPVFAAERLLGGITLDSHDPARRFSADDQRLLHTVAASMGVALENVRLFDETREALEQQTATAEVLGVISRSVEDTAPVFEAIGRACQRLFSSDSVIVSLVDEQACVRHVHQASPPELSPGEYDLAWNRLNQGFPRPLAQSYQSYPIRKRRTVHYPDIVHGERVPESMRQIGREVGNFSMLIAPMLRGDLGIGTVHVVRRPPRPFSDIESALLASFASQAVNAIENVRLFNETRSALERQTATAEILKVISASPTDTQPVFDAIVRSVARLFGRKAALRTVEPDGLRRRASSYEPEPGEFHGPPTMPIEPNNLVGRAVLECRALQVADTYTADAMLYMREHASELSFRSIASAPLVYEGKAIGVISVSSPEPGAMSDEQMSLLATFADQAVIAIQNARLFRQAQEARAAAEAAQGFFIDTVRLSVGALARHHRSLDLGARRQRLEFITRLQRQPRRGVAPEVLRQAGGGVGGDAAALIHDLVDARRRHPQRRGQRVHAQPQRCKVVFAQYFAGMHRAQAVHRTCGVALHVGPSMVVNDFNIQRPRCGPHKAHPPLVVDADAVLTDTVALERFEAIAGRRAKELQRARGVQLREFALGHMRDGAKAPRRPTFELGLRVLAAERLNHEGHSITPTVIPGAAR